MIYSELRLYEEAVNLALQWGAKNGDYDLAKQNARLPEDEEKKKQLWCVCVMRSFRVSPQAPY